MELEIITCKIILLLLRLTEEERRVGDQKEKGSEPGHLPRALSRQLQPVC